MSDQTKKRKLSSSGTAHKKIHTRSHAGHFLIGPSIESIGGSKLPTLKQVLQYVLHLRETSPRNTPVKWHIEMAVEKVTIFWLFAGISMIKKQNTKAKLERSWATWQSLKKSKDREIDVGGKREAFMQKLERLWDIGALDAIAKIQSNRLLSAAKKAEDIAFYEDQRGPRVATMNGQDKVLKEKVQKQQQRLSVTVHLSSSEEELSESPETPYEDDTSNGEFSVPSSSRTSKHTSSNFISLLAPVRILDDVEICKALDRLKVSDRAGTMLVAAFIKACNGNPDEFRLSRSSSYRSRIAQRLQISQSIFESVTENPPKNVAIHWDGKLTKNRLGDQAEALAVVASGSPTFESGKLLGIQRLENGSGKAQAESSFELLELWDLARNTKALVFDTTSANSGWKSGAAVLLEERLHTKVFYLACRHHVYELIIKAVWKCLFGETTGPVTNVFYTFQQKWSKIDKRKPFKILHFDDDWLLMKAEGVKEELIHLLQSKQKKNVFIRDDYKECATGTLAILGHESYRSHSFRKPGATHHARWMSQVLYCQKMYLWMDQMDYAKDFKEKLRRINQFIALFYVPAWLKSSIGSEAPVNDLLFLHDMKKYSFYDSQVAGASFKKLHKHHWYLNEETAVFALFSDHSDMTNEMKKRIATKLLETPRPSQFRRGVPFLRCPISESTTIADLIGPNSWFIFEALCIGSEWLALPVTEWQSRDEFMQASAFARTVKVVNDAAERMIKLNTDFAAYITDSEEQRASLLQVVEHHRRQYPDFRKATIAQKHGLF